MKKNVLVPLLVWELIVFACIAAVMLTFGKSLNLENERKLGIMAGAGIFVVLLCWPVCSILPRPATWIVGSVVGLVTPPLCAWTWAWLLPFPYWTGPLEIKILSFVLSIPSALAGMVVGGLQARTSHAGKGGSTGQVTAPGHLA
jgi:hypothetical protein